MLVLQVQSYIMLTVYYYYYYYYCYYFFFYTLGSIDPEG